MKAWIRAAFLAVVTAAVFVAPAILIPTQQTFLPKVTGPVFNSGQLAVVRSWAPTRKANAQLQDTGSGVATSIRRDSIAVNLTNLTATKVLAGVTTTPAFSSVTTFTRTGTAWARNSSWVYSLFADATIRQTDLGSPQEGARNQYARHNTSLDITHQLTVTGGSGTFTNGETVTATGGGSGKYIAANGNAPNSTSTLYAISNGTGTFTGTLTGGSSGATKTISSSTQIWVQSNVTVTADQTGFDGTSNRGSRVKATSDNGTLCQTVSDATSRARGDFWIVKRVAGTNKIWGTRNNFSTQTELAVGTNTSYQLYQLGIDSNLSNPTICVKLEKANDEFAILGVQDENSAAATAAVSTLIPTFTATPVTRNVERLDVTDLSHMGNYDRGTLRAEVGTIIGMGNFFREPANVRFDSQNKYVVEINSTAVIDAMRPAIGSLSGGIVFDGNSSLPVTQTGGPYRGVLAWEAHSCHAAASTALALTSPSHDCSQLPTVANTGLTPTLSCGSNAGGQNLYAYLRYCEIANARDSDATNNTWAN